MVIYLPPLIRGYFPPRRMRFGLLIR